MTYLRYILILIMTLSLMEIDMSLTYTAELNEAGQAMLLVYSAGGALMQKYDFGSGNGIRTCDFTLPKTGVYIVKALTDDNEYTYKIGGHQ